MLLASVNDRARQCDERYSITSTSFLDIRQRIFVEASCRSNKEILWLNEDASGNYDNPDVTGTGRVRGFLFGGYPDAERRIVLFLPDYEDLSNVLNSSEACPLAVIRAQSGRWQRSADDSSNMRKLSHRDYLGSLLGLGLKREVIGDILVRDDGADIIILREIVDFLMMNYEKAGRTSLKLSLHPITELKTAEIKIIEKRDTVASLRIDNLVSAAFDISRSKAQEAIKQGIVFVNSALVQKPDKELQEGDKLVLRGKGKAVLKEISGVTRKDRIYVFFDKYI